MSNHKHDFGVMNMCRSRGCTVYKEMYEFLLELRKTGKVLPEQQSLANEAVTKGYIMYCTTFDTGGQSIEIPSQAGLTSKGESVITVEVLVWETTVLLCSSCQKESGYGKDVPIHYANSGGYSPSWEGRLCSHLTPADAVAYYKKF